jgi:hypothetical protein
MKKRGLFWLMGLEARKFKSVVLVSGRELVLLPLMVQRGGQQVHEREKMRSALLYNLSSPVRARTCLYEKGIDPFKRALPFLFKPLPLGPTFQHHHTGDWVTT